MKNKNIDPGSVINNRIADGVLGTRMIDDGAVQSNRLADGSVPKRKPKITANNKAIRTAPENKASGGEEAAAPPIRRRKGKT